MGEGCDIRAARAWVRGVAGAVLLALASAAPTLALAAAQTPARLAAEIEQRADRTSFPALESFGETAIRGHDRESLRRLAHVTGVLPVSYTHLTLPTIYSV